jgi:hypothetical protein
MEDSREHGNELSGSIKFWEILVAEQQTASQEGLNFKDFISKVRLRNCSSVQLIKNHSVKTYGGGEM